MVKYWMDLGRNWKLMLECEDQVSLRLQLVILLDVPADGADGTERS